jgi:hypothetical protein
MGYYDSHIKTVANNIELAINRGETPHFPDEGLCIGSLNLPNVQLPALIDLFDSKGLCFLYDSDNNRRTVNNCLEQLAWRIALCLPPELCEYVVYNGGNPGDSFNSLNKLNKSLFKSSDKVMFDANSEEFTKHLSQVYQGLAARITNIREAGFSNLFELNRHEGVDAKFKYTFLFISDFTRITEEQKRLIIKIISADCSISGVFPFISWDMRANLEKSYGTPLDYSLLLDSLTLLFPKEDRYYFKNSGNDELMNKFVLRLDSAKSNKEQLNDWAEIINKRIEKASAVSNDIRKQVLNASSLWSKTSKHGMEIPIGSASSSKNMNLELCPQRDSTIVHGLIGGTTGSGKSTLLHDIIINSAWLYSPDELQFILLDFKSVEFGIYSGLPHVRVLSTKSDREYGSNVLAYIVSEIEFRKKLFGRVSSIEEYNNEQHHVPRILVIIDEFHNLFVSEGTLGDLRESNISSQINKHFNKILKEGRSFGIHLLLATQEAGGIQSIDSYLQQIKLRIVLKMEEKGKFLTYENTARPDKLRRGEGIYNDDFGKEDSNNQFRFAFYGNDVKTHKQVIESEMIEAIRKKSVEVYNTYSPCEKCFYRGGGESTIDDNTNVVTEVNDERCLVFVGSPVTVRREDVSFELKRKRGNNILIIAANSDYLESLVHLTFSQVIKQSNSNSTFMVCVSSNDEYNNQKSENVNVLKDNEGLQSAVLELNSHLEARQNGNESVLERIFFALLGLRFFDILITNSDLRKQLENIVLKGAELGIHTLIHSSNLSDFDKAFQQEFSFDGGSSMTPEELMREFNVKVELKGDDGYKLFSTPDRNNSPHEDFLANIQTKESGAITKFSIYQQ